jgi:hypothetical protein
MNLRILISLATALCLLCSCASTTKQTLNTSNQPKSDNGHAMAEVTGNFKKVESIDDIPPIIIERLRNEDEKCLGVANPSEEYNPGCGVGYGGLPCRKLLSGGSFKDIWFIEYLTGGAASVKTFVAFRIENNHIISLLSYGFFDIMRNHGTIKLSTQELSDRLPSQPICSEKNRDQYIVEVKFGLCTPAENSYYRKYLPKQT